MCVWQTLDVKLSDLQMEHWQNPSENTKNTEGWVSMIESSEINMTHCQVIISTSSCISFFWRPLKIICPFSGTVVVTKPQWQEAVVTLLHLTWRSSCRESCWLLRLKCNPSNVTDFLFETGISDNVYENAPAQNNIIRHTLRATLSSQPICGNRELDRSFILTRWL